MTFAEWKQQIEDSPKDACLYALTSLALKNIDEKYRKSYYEILDYLKVNNNNDNIYRTKLQDIFFLFEDGENILINNLNDIITNIHNKISSNNSCSMNNTQSTEKIKITRWWTSEK